MFVNGRVGRIGHWKSDGIFLGIIGFPPSGVTSQPSAVKLPQGVGPGFWNSVDESAVKPRSDLVELMGRVNVQIPLYIYMLIHLEGSRPLELTWNVQCYQSYKSKEEVEDLTPPKNNQHRQVKGEKRSWLNFSDIFKNYPSFVFAWPRETWVANDKDYTKSVILTCSRGTLGAYPVWKLYLLLNRGSSVLIWFCLSLFTTVTSWKAS